MGPTGYGKSTLVGAWLAKTALPAAWLSLDEMDDEPGRFFLYFIAAIQRTEPAFCTELFAALQAGQLPTADVLVTILVNELSGWAERLVVSVNTVRYHGQGVYGKLGVEEQTQAVERGRALGLI